MDVLSRIGIGSATVDTAVPEVVTAGETVEGRIDIEGGSTDQEIDGIYLALETRYERYDGFTVGDEAQAAVTEKLQSVIDRNR